MTPVIEIEEVHAYYGSSDVLRGTSLCVREGEAVGLVGRNGMGKTSTLRVLLGLLPPRSGRLRVHGRDMTHSATHRIAHAGIALVPEGRGIFPNLSVHENLVMAARPGRDGRTDWTHEHILATFPRLAERRRHMGSQLSGGEQQMLAIARALMTNPDLLVLDEATEGLAPLLRRDVWAVIRQIRAAGIAALIVDRDIRALADCVDRCLVMSKGRIVHTAAPQELAADRAALTRYLAV